MHKNCFQVHEPETRELIEQRFQSTVTEMRDSVFKDVVNSLPFDDAGTDWLLILRFDQLLVCDMNYEPLFISQDFDIDFLS